MTKVKICGLTNLEDTLEAYKLGADFLGFIFVNDTPRYAGEIKNTIRDLPQELKDKAGRVGIFRNEAIDIVKEIVSECDLGYIQLHGDEAPEYCREVKEFFAKEFAKPVKVVKAFKIDKEILMQGPHNFSDYENVDYFIFDTFHPRVPGGTGVVFDWSVLIKRKEEIKKPFFIAGGLTPDNVSQAVQTVHPFGVDTSSGVEKSFGKKDYKLVKEFIKNAKKI